MNKIIEEIIDIKSRKGFQVDSENVYEIIDLDVKLEYFLVYRIN